VRPSRHQTIRDILLEAEDGLTLVEIGEKMGTTERSLRKTIGIVWGVYIDRWTNPKRGQYAAVYMCADVPEDAPHPLGAMA